MIKTTTLWRPVGPKELELIQKLEMRAFPPRLPEQPIFYPVLSEDYAVKIARDWNVPHDGEGYVTCFDVKRTFIEQYDVQQAGGRECLEYWIPAEDLNAFNRAIVGEIRVVAEFGLVDDLMPIRNDFELHRCISNINVDDESSSLGRDLGRPFATFGNRT